MKRFLCLSLIFSTLFFSLPKKNAHSGVIVGGVTSFATWVNGEIFSPISLIPIGMMGTGMLILKFASSTQAGLTWGFGLVLLDAEKELNRSVLTKQLATHYPFINNEDITSELSEKIISRYDELKTLDLTTVSLSENEVLEIIAPLDLTDVEVNTLIKDLK